MTLQLLTETSFLFTASTWFQPEVAKDEGKRKSPMVKRCLPCKSSDLLNDSCIFSANGAVEALRIFICVSVHVTSANEPCRTSGNPLPVSNTF